MGTGPGVFDRLQIRDQPFHLGGSERVPRLGRPPAGRAHEHGVHAPGQPPLEHVLHQTLQHGPHLPLGQGGGHGAHPQGAPAEGLQIKTQGVPLVPPLGQESGGLGRGFPHPGNQERLPRRGTG